MPGRANHARRNNVEYYAGWKAYNDGIVDNPYTKSDFYDSRWARWELGWKESKVHEQASR